MLTIGFANKFYTLWDCTVDVNTDDRGIKHTVCKNQYIKNISFDLNKAQNLYPGAPVDESLKGHTGSFTCTYIEYPDDMFKYGKYCGMKFKEVNDYEYMAWYFTTTGVKSQEELMYILKNHGYRFFPYFDKTWGIETEEEYQKRLAHDAVLDIVRESVINDFNNGTLEFFIGNNLSYEGEYYDAKSEFTLKFDSVKANYYQGFEYYLPVLNGKCKRIKNKFIHILDGEIIDGVILVHNFEVVKK